MDYLETNISPELKKGDIAENKLRFVESDLQLETYNKLFSNHLK